MTAVAGRGSRAVAGTTWPRLTAFVVVAAAVVVADQVSKAWVDRSFGLSGSSVAVSGSYVAPTPVLGDFVRIAKGYNNGAIFGLLGSSVSFFAVASLVAIAVIVWWEVARGGRGSFLLTLTLGLLLGGAIGNEIDRVRLGYVIDFVDMGIGTWRFYTFNVADSAISVSIVVLFLIGLFGDPFAPGRDVGAGADRATAAGPHAGSRPG
jgi:signal peptidase II